MRSNFAPFSLDCLLAALFASLPRAQHMCTTMASVDPQSRDKLASYARVAAPSIWAAVCVIISAWLLLPRHVFVASVIIVGLTTVAQGAAIIAQKFIPRLPGLIWMMLVRAVLAETAPSSCNFEPTHNPPPLLLLVHTMPRLA